jgi:TetR/AcrR family transcriptional regulator, tetracycline repressor protein
MLIKQLEAQPWLGQGVPKQLRPGAGRSSRRPSAANHSDVVQAAIAIVNTEGADALTIRRVAQACGLSPMGVYRHIRDEDDLLTGSSTP